MNSAGNRNENKRGSRSLWLTRTKTFCTEASVVGLRYVANPSSSLFRRSVWLLLLLAGAAFTTFQIQDRIRWYWSYPKNVNIRVEHVEELRFPTVTICNENQVSRKTADARGTISVFTARRYVLTQYMLSSRLSIRLSVTRQSSTHR